ncbi:type IV toxin-antitoxin system AbiEi family antitoxin domain-containing protein [Gordonia sp. SL306]|nr:type IV toxin-antitoxin system AbiEi family antitoxin domain-containing protein [Gordonia sp. SL306]WAC56925.1 type IV toxin-antitoxin system AbiEi family antitoxin domain-containing protein [Gordonia sp. SL306]
MEDQAALRKMLADHDGVFTTAQAYGCGVSGDQLRRRVRSGEWIPST